jgi:hypothetical protein
MHLRQWPGRRDRDHAALRRAGRTAIVVPGLFALGDETAGVGSGLARGGAAHRDEGVMENWPLA